MKTSQLPLALLVVCLASVAACHQQDQPVEIPAPVFNGVKVDLPKLETEFATASADALQTLSRIRHNLNYGLYPKAVMELERLAKLPNLTDAQKQALARVIEQTQSLLKQPAGK